MWHMSLACHTRSRQGSVEGRQASGRRIWAMRVESVREGERDKKEREGGEKKNRERERERERERPCAPCTAKGEL